jgi:hypothetical protein
MSGLYEVKEKVLMPKDFVGSMSFIIKDRWST